MLSVIQIYLLVLSLGAPTQSSAIVGGSPASPGQYPWSVSIFLSGLYQCTGLLVAPDWVLTSASCPCAIEQLASFVEIVAGDYSLSHEDAGEVPLKVLQAFPHPDYDSSLNLNNLALIQLTTAVQLTDTIQVATIGNSFSDCLMVGWGADDADSNQGLSDILQSLRVSPESSERCNETDYSFPTAEEMRCVFPPVDTQGFGACSNDYGSNIVCNSTEGTTVSGIVTFFDGDVCGDLDHPTIVTDLGYFSQWITDNIYKDSCQGVHLPDKPHGEWQCQVEDGKICRLVCYQNFVNEGGSEVTCQDDGWTPSPDSLACQEIPCPAGYEKINHRCYSNSYDHQMAWLDAVKTCEQDSAQLVQFSSREELMSVSTLIDSGQWWTMANDWYEETVWRWGFTDIFVKPEVWENLEEDTEENCAFLQNGEMWQGECSLERGVICEKKLGAV